MALNVNDEALLREAFRNLADKALPPNSKFYESIYERVGGENPVAKLRTCIEYAEEESLQLFSGFRGTGKTTELYRLRHELEQAGYFVLYADALKYISASEEIDIVTMLLSVAGAFGEQLEAAGINTLGESYWQRFTNYLTKTTVEVSEISLTGEAALPAKELLGDLKAGVDLKMALKTAPSFRQKLNAFLANRLSDLKQQINTFVEAGVKAVRLQKGSPDLKIVFLFDQFEQLHGSRSNEQSVIQSVEKLFASHLEQLKLPYVHVIYTVPPWLQFVLPGTFSIETLPCVRLWNLDAGRTRYETGWKLLREVIIKRLGEEAFKRILGEHKAGESAADQLIAMSGGHFRDLLRLFRETILQIRTSSQTLPASKDVLNRAIINVRNEYLPIAIDDACWLEQIGQHRDLLLPNSTPDTIGRVSRFLDSHLVLFLTNGKDWYDLHPLIREEVSLLAKLPVPAKT